MKRCLPMPQRYAKDHTDTKDRVNNLERRDGGDCGYQRADCGNEMDPNHYYRFEEATGNFQDEVGTADLTPSGAGTALTRHAAGVDDSFCIAYPAVGGNWGTPFGGTVPEFPTYAGGLFDMSLGSFAIGIHFWPSSTHPLVATTDDGWVPLCGQGSGETASGDYEGMLWYNWHTNVVAVCFNHYEFATADTHGAPRQQALLGHFRESAAVITENAWNKVLWVHDDAAAAGVGQEKIYVNGVTVDSTFTSEDGMAVGQENFVVGQMQYAHSFLAHFFGIDLVRWLGGGSRVDNCAVWPDSMPTAGEIDQFMNGTGNLSENGTWVITSGHDVAKARVKVNGA
jgi:hypothetical protein